MIKVLLSGNIIKFIYILITKFKFTLTSLFVIGAIYIINNPILSQDMIVNLWEDNTTIIKCAMFFIVSADALNIILRIFKTSSKRALRMYLTGM
jgi:hypothetical protein